LATSDVAVDALFRKAGIVRCYHREELLAVASVFMHPELKGRNIAVVTHAGGPAVMMTDVLSNNGLNVPHLEGPAADELLTKLFHGSSVGNPIDFLATGTAEQLGIIIDYCNNQFDNIDAVCIIFGNPGLFKNWDTYQLIDEKMKTSKKPIFPVLPSVYNSKEEIEDFIHHRHRINFPDECTLAAALAKVTNTPKPQPANPKMPEIDVKIIRETIDRCENGYISLENIRLLLDAAGIGRKKEVESAHVEDLLAYARKEGYPLVMKVVGPVHKSDVGGVVLNVKDEETIRREFDRLMKIKDTYAVEIYKMLFGTELFIGASREDKFGHQVLFGLGGIFIEILKDVQAALTPVSMEEARGLIQQLKGYKILQGIRGQQPVNEDLFAETVAKVSALVSVAPEIVEMDLNPLLGTPDSLIAVDARIRIEK
jgi:acetyltransferase